MANSIEQRAKEYTCCNYSRIGDMYMDDGIKTVYTEAATVQRKLDIEKACEWFRRENSHAVKEWLELECDRLRKYMEEEQ